MSIIPESAIIGILKTLVGRIPDEELQQLATVAKHWMQIDTALKNEMLEVLKERYDNGK